MISSTGVAGALLLGGAAVLSRAGRGSGAPSRCPPRRSRQARGPLHFPRSLPGGQTPLGPDIAIDPRQIEQDLAQLKTITDCVRTYSVDHGLDRIAESEHHGLKVFAGAVAVELPGSQSQADRDHARARHAVSRCDHRRDRRERGPVARGNVVARPRRHDPPRQSERLDAGHLRGCVGVLAALP